MMTRKKHILLVAVLLLSLVPTVAHAQLYGFDVGSVEALIANHKSVRSRLIARSSLEQANELLHQYSKEAAEHHDSINIQLDKYTKCFDIIDIIYRGGITVANVYYTHNDVKDKIVQLQQLITEFTVEFTAKGNILSSDMVIINACKSTISQVGEDGQSLINSLIELSQYAAGKEAGREMTTEQLLTTISNINDCLDNIRNCIDHAYFVIQRYITLRRTYFKKSLYHAKTVREMAQDAFSVWFNTAHEVGYK